jgi:hypothetical protein
MGKKQIKAMLTISCDVLIDDAVKRNIEEVYSTSLSEQEIANKLLYAFLNPKVELFNDLENVDGYWDMVCEFNGRLNNFIVEPED